MVSAGLDFFFATKSDAVKMVDFFQNVAPIKYACAWFVATALDSPSTVILLA